MQEEVTGSSSALGFEQTKEGHCSSHSLCSVSSSALHAAETAA